SRSSAGTPNSPATTPPASRFGSPIRSRRPIRRPAPPDRGPRIAERPPIGRSRNADARGEEGDDADMSEYQEFTGKTVEEALRNAREAFGVGGLDDIDFEILTPGSRGVLGMGAEPARIVAAPRAALGGAAPKREAAAAVPLPPAPARPPREDRPYDDRGPRRDDRAPRRDDRPRDDRP